MIYKSRFKSFPVIYYSDLNHFSSDLWFGFKSFLWWPNPALFTAVRHINVQCRSVLLVVAWATVATQV